MSAPASGSALAPDGELSEFERRAARRAPRALRRVQPRSPPTSRAVTARAARGAARSRSPQPVSIRRGAAGRVARARAGRGAAAAVAAMALGDRLAGAARLGMPAADAPRSRLRRRRARATARELEQHARAAARELARRAAIVAARSRLGDQPPHRIGKTAVRRAGYASARARRTSSPRTSERLDHAARVAAALERHGCAGDRSAAARRSGRLRARLPAPSRRALRTTRDVSPGDHMSEHETSSAGTSARSSRSRAS